MKNLVSILMFATLALTNVNASEVRDFLQEIELKTYDPQKQGLKDLVFEARIDNLSDILRSLGNFGNVTDINFKIYWIPANEYRVEVNGLPKGFEEVKNDLAMLIKSKLDYVVPTTLKERLNGYDLAIETVAGGKKLVATDSQGKMAVLKMDLEFDKAAKLSSINYVTANQKVETKLQSSPKSWSNNKILLDTITITTKQGIQTNIITNKVEYLTVSGIGFPSKLTINNLSKASIPAQGKEKAQELKQETGSVIRFTNYEVNTGKAQKYITGGLKR